MDGNWFSSCWFTFKAAAAAAAAEAAATAAAAAAAACGHTRRTAAAVDWRLFNRRNSASTLPFGCETVLLLLGLRFWALLSIWGQHLQDGEVAATR
jgi:hypothetical protein